MRVRNRIPFGGFIAGAICALLVAWAYPACAGEKHSGSWTILAGDFKWKNPGADPYTGNQYAGILALFHDGPAALAVSKSVEETKPRRGRLCQDGSVHVGDEFYAPTAMVFGKRTVAQGRIIPTFLTDGKCEPVHVHQAVVDGKTYTIGFPEACNNPTRLEAVEESPPEKTAMMQQCFSGYTTVTPRGTLFSYGTSIYSGDFGVDSAASSAGVVGNGSAAVASSGAGVSSFGPTIGLHSWSSPGGHSITFTQGDFCQLVPQKEVHDE